MHASSLREMQNPSYRIENTVEKPHDYDDSKIL
jgi:hypothetical protein